MVKYCKLENSAYYYGYFQNGKIILIPKQISRYYQYARNFVQTLADYQERNIYLYSINEFGEIYFCRKITCVQNKCKEATK